MFLKGWVSMKKYDLDSMIKSYQSDMVKMAKRVTVTYEEDGVVETETVLDVETVLTSEFREEEKIVLCEIEEEVDIKSTTKVLENESKETASNNSKEVERTEEWPEAVPVVSTVLPEEIDAGYDSYTEFLKRNTVTGFLKVQVTTEGQLMPIENVNIVISKTFGDDMRTFYTVQTDENGIADNLSLATVPKLESQQPMEIKPYESYDITADHPDYNQFLFKDAPIFDGIKSIQPIVMIPIE